MRARVRGPKAARRSAGSSSHSGGSVGAGTVKRREGRLLTVPFRPLQWHVLAHAACELDLRDVNVKAGLQYHDLVAWTGRSGRRVAGRGGPEPSASPPRAHRV